jgi:predicted peroxiredoxin
LFNFQEPHLEIKILDKTRIHWILRQELQKIHRDIGLAINMEEFMRVLTALVLGVVLSVSALSTKAFAGDKDPLFVNLTTNDAWRAVMALTFSRHQLDTGHPVTIFLNDHGVFLASKKYSRKFAREQKMIRDFVAKGGVVLMCDMCMHKFVIEKSQIIPQVTVSQDNSASKALFQDHTKTLTW